MRFLPLFLAIGCAPVHEASPDLDDDAVSTCRTPALAWEVDNGHGAIHVSAVSDSGLVALAGEDGSVKLWDLADPDGPTGELGAAYGAEWSVGEVTALAFAGDDRLAVGTDLGEVLVFDASGLPRFSVMASEEAVVDLAWSPDGEILGMLDAGFSGNPQLLEADTGDQVRTIPTALWQGTRIEFLDDDTLLLAGDWYGVPWVERTELSAEVPGPYWSAQEWTFVVSHQVSTLHVEGDDLYLGIRPLPGVGEGSWWARVRVSDLSFHGHTGAPSAPRALVGGEHGLIGLTEEGLTHVDRESLESSTFLAASLSGLHRHGEALVGASAEGELQLYGCEQ